MNKIERSLYDAGYRKDTGIKRGWYMTIDANGPPGLSTIEQDINRWGGRFCGKDAAVLLRKVIVETADYLVYLNKGREDQQSEEAVWWIDWIKDAEAALGEKK